MEDGIDYQSVPALDVPFFTSNISAQDDEMLSWLQYPLEDTFDKSQSPEPLGENINPHVHLMKDAFIHQTMRGFEKTNDASTRINIEDHRSFSNSPQRHNETQHPSETHPNAFFEGKASNMPLNINVDTSSGRRKEVGSAQQPLPFEKQNQEIRHRFPLFSSSVSATLDNLLIVGAASGVTNMERVRKEPLSRELISSCQMPNDSSYLDIVRGIQKPELEKPSEDRNFDSSKLYMSDELSERQNSEEQRTSVPANFSCEEDVYINDVRKDLNGNSVNASESTLSENGAGTVETIVFPPGKPGYVQSKTTQGVSSASAEKSFPDEESEDLEELVTTKKNRSSRPCTSKRSRAAEVHNESEKRRRNRINIKLKALQELIPNSTKTDKASVLDEAIEYTKMLQSQVQMMSMRTGFVLQPVMMPGGIQYLPVQQMPMLPPMGMKQGVGIGMGLIGMNTPHPNQQVVQLCPMPGQSLQVYPGSQILNQASIPTVNVAEGHSPPTLHVKDPCSTAPPQQSIQPSDSNGAKNALLQQNQTEASKP